MSTIPGQPAGCRVGGQPHPTGGGAQGVAPPVEAATRRRRAGGPLDQPADGSPVVNLTESLDSYELHFSWRGASRQPSRPMHLHRGVAP